MIKEINIETLDLLSRQAKKSDRKRKNFNYHLDFSDPINRMLNALDPETYVQPHKHENPDKREVFILLRGKLLVVFFENDGRIKQSLILDNIKNFGVEIAPKVWHTIVALEPKTVVYEVKDGPYSQTDDKNFAPWAPKEGETGCLDFLNNLKKLGI